MPSIKDIVAGQSVGIGKRVIKAGADKLRGIINDRTGGNMPTFGTFDVKKLTYPMDVVEDPRQGHYVIFTVREISKEARVNVKADEKGELGVYNQDGKKLNLNKINEDTKDSQAKSGTEDSSNGNGKKDKDTVRYVDINAERDSNRRYAIRPPTKRTSTLITLYMPPQVKNITGAEYESV